MEKYAPLGFKAVVLLNTFAMGVGLKAALALFTIGLFLGALPGLFIHNEFPAGKNFELLVCPEDDCAERLVSFIGSAEKSVHVMVYSFTKKELAEALAEAEKKGLDVKIVLDKTQAAGPHSVDELLSQHGISVKLAALPGNAIMHHKVAIVDSNCFSTGSFNYSENADSGSAENVLIGCDAVLAKRLEKEFESLWNS